MAAVGTNVSCASDDLKNLLHDYASNCADESDFWQMSACPLLPGHLRVDAEVEFSESATTKNLVHGMIAVFGISLCSTFGALFIPLLKDRPQVFQYSMLYLMSLAVSALSGAATMVLIPEGLGLNECDDLRQPNLTVCLGILTFFIIRRILHAWTGHDDILTHGLEDPENGEMRARTTGIFQNEMKLEKAQLVDTPTSSETPSENCCASKRGSSCERQKKCAMKKKIALDNILKMKSVGWMTLIGDGAHNFLDGIAMGSMFMRSGTKKGWQITIAILAEEFPHELGDYAVLLQAGLTPCEAIICNIISGLTCLLGFFVGWKIDAFAGLEVFSWMGGVFLFISLACMLPEVENTISDMNREHGKAKKVLVTLVAIAGFISGYAIVYLAGVLIVFE